MTPRVSPEHRRSSLEKICREGFRTALLLTGSVARAEIAVTEALRSWNPEDFPEEVLTSRIIEASIKSGAADDMQSASDLLCGELGPVLDLAAQTRHCFVMRMLLNLPRAECARRLGFTPLQVDEYTRRAVAELASCRADIPAPLTDTAPLPICH